VCAAAPRDRHVTIKLEHAGRFSQVSRTIVDDERIMGLCLLMKEVMKLSPAMQKFEKEENMYAGRDVYMRSTTHMLK
jgi:hypothetical protein